MSRPLAAIALRARLQEQRGRTRRECRIAPRLAPESLRQPAIHSYFAAGIPGTVLHPRPIAATPLWAANGHGLGAAQRGVATI